VTDVDACHGRRVARLPAVRRSFLTLADRLDAPGRAAPHDVLPFRRSSLVARRPLARPAAHAGRSSFSVIVPLL
jgi:hypothetical protein